MSTFLIPVSHVELTFNEVPDKTAVSFVMGDCRERCKGCHSPYLWEKPKGWTIDKVCEIAEKYVSQGADAILLMGGTTNGIPYYVLDELITELARIADVGLYSGSNHEEFDKDFAMSTRLTWLKTGSFKKDLGGLSSPTTNQRFYRKKRRYYMCLNSGCVEKREWLEDITHFFQNGNKWND